MATTSSDAIAQRFARLKADGRRAFVPYVTAGHPDRARSVALLQGLEESGADVVEVGVPFSDPLADGAVIQASSQTALDQGIRFDQVLEIIATAGLTIPVVLFSYLNPLLRGGDDALRRAADAGAHGVLVTDLPLGADAERERWFARSPLAFIRLVAP
ncbi:MAG: tryptophan synthase subunit alpha, partial [Gemmatimonadota bacterium]|nr:tryptophan synthase subunit alpha [Gemmatimonadota bacterium]